MLADGDIKWMDTHCKQFEPSKTFHVWDRIKKELVESSKTPDNNERDVICLEYEQNKQCEACVDWVCGSQPCLLNRKLSPVS